MPGLLNWEGTRHPTDIVVKPFVVYIKVFVIRLGYIIVILMVQRVARFNFSQFEKAHFWFGIYMPESSRKKKKVLKKLGVPLP